jgi:phage terminase large subunit-like protein
VSTGLSSGTNSRAASESLFTRSLREIGPAKLKARLASVKLGAFVKDPPAEFAELTALDCLDYLWTLTARPEQLPPATFDTWFIRAGRGWGKTRTGAQATVAAAEDAARLVAQGLLAPEEARIHLVGATSADARDVMTGGPAGIVRCSPPWFPATFEPSRRRIVWPGGVEALIFSAEEPDRLRGPQGIFAWADELAAWKYLDATWDNLQFGIRLGPRPRICVTTTPRPIRRIREILGQPGTIDVHRPTSDNAGNLSPKALAKLYAQYSGTRLGRQELEAEILDDNPGALWRLQQIDDARVAVAPQLRRIVVAVDPAVTSRANSDETGVVVAGIAKCSCKGSPEDHGFVLEDISGTYSPDGWAKVVAAAYVRHKADRVVAEVNQGGDLVEATLRTVDARISYKAVHASRGKQIRAEPISALYQQAKIHHVGSFPKLEDQLTQWDPQTEAWSPDRLDALVWGLTDLMLGEQTRPIMGLRW